MPIRIISVLFVCQLLLACSAGTVSTKEYSDADISSLRQYAWHGLAKVESGENVSNDMNLVDAVESNLKQILAVKGFTEVARDQAQLLIGLHLQLDNALDVEKFYRQRPSGVFAPADKTFNSYETNSNVLLPDTPTALYGGQQRGTVSMTVCDAKTNQTVITGDATVVFPYDLSDQNQISHLNKTLAKLTSRLFD